jgi:hypothetical protein
LTTNTITKVLLHIYYYITNLLLLLYYWLPTGEGREERGEGRGDREELRKERGDGEEHVFLDIYIHLTSFPEDCGIRAMRACGSSKQMLEDA